MMSSAVTPSYEVHGSAETTESLVLIAGTGYPGRTWPADFIDLLSPHVRVVTFDHRGTGATPPTAAAYSTSLFADDVAALIAELGGPSHVLGHSMGGRVAQWLAIKHPDVVKSLILAASGTGGTTAETQTRGVPVSTCVGISSLGYEGYVRDLQRRTFFTHEFVVRRPDIVGALGEAFWSGAPTLEEYLKHVVARQAHDASGRVGRIDAETLVLVGEHDTHAGGTGSHYDQSVALARLIPRSEFAVVRGCRHGMFWEQPELTAQMVHDWIQDHQ